MGRELREHLGTKLQSKTGKTASGAIWPNGEFTLGWVKDKVEVATHREEEGELIFTSLKPLVRRSHLVHLCGEIHTEMTPAPSCQWPRVKYGLKGITRYGKRFVRSGAALLQRKYGRFRLSFLTLTLPELPGSKGAKIAEGWGRVVNRLIQWLQRSLTRLGLPKSVIGVSELQPQRLQDGSICVLHLHLCFCGRSKSRGPWGLRPVEVRKAWLNILSNELGERVESSACEELRMVKKSAEGYLGKYMSKGSADVSHFVEMGEEHMVPGQWWFCTKVMRDWVKSEMMKGPHTGELLQSIIEFHCQAGFENSGIWACPFFIDLDGIPLLVAWVGRFSKEFYGNLRKCLLK